MNEIITGIRVIKMYAWEHAFKRVVSAIRKWVVCVQCYVCEDLCWAHKVAGCWSLADL